jgi:penicillin-binding protein 1A
MVIDNRNGSIRAIVGGRDFSESPFNRAREAHRQIGSTFKPFEYAAAFQRGLLPGTLVDDGPITRGEIEGAENWHPENSDGVFHGPLPAEQGLIQSRNTMSIRVGQRAGLSNVLSFANSVGFTKVPAQPAVYLGAFESTLAEVTAAYTVFPNFGTRRQPYIIERIDDSSGETIYRAPHVAQQVADPAVCWVTNATLMKVMDKGGTGASVKSEGFTKPCAGKTGTTNDYVDAWFVGYTTSLTCGVWVGLDQPKTIISKGYGAALALPVWADVMAAATKGDRYPAKDFGGPEPMRTMLCSVSGELATGGCEAVGTAYTDDLPPSLVPRNPCHLHRGSILTERKREHPRRSVGEGILRSFRKFFGGD